MRNTARPEELRAFESGGLDPAQFPHAEHLRFGYEMLNRYSFGEAVSRFSAGLKLLAAKAGKPEVYHETITVAFLALINERRARDKTQAWPEFKHDNADLFDKRCLERWYGAEQLGSELARRAFCLPTLPPAPLVRRPRASLASRETPRKGAGLRSRVAAG